MTEDGRAPDYFEPVVGWRTWLVQASDGRPRLGSMVFAELWVPGRELHADCRRRRLVRWPFGNGPHEAPRRRCECGVHAGDLATALYYLTSSYWDGRGLGRVLGRVSLWGTVVEHEAGWRASRAYPLELYVPHPPSRAAAAEELAAALADYGVPVLVLPVATPGDLVRALDGIDVTARS